VFVQALFAEFAVERFDVAVLHRAARGDEVQRHLVFVSPLVQRFRGELRAMINDDPLRQPTFQPQPVQNADDTQRRQEVSTSMVGISRVPDGGRA